MVEDDEEAISEDYDGTGGSDLSCSGQAVEAVLNEIIGKQANTLAMMMVADDSQRARVFERVRYALEDVRTRSDYTPLECAALMKLQPADVEGLSAQDATVLVRVVNYFMGVGLRQWDVRYTVEQTDEGKLWVEMLPQ